MALPKIRKRLGGNKTLLIPVGLVLLTVWLRFKELATLPPGLHPLEADLGIMARSGKLFGSLNEIQHSITTAFAKLAISLNLDPILELRVGFATASVLAAWFFYQWIKLTYGRRPAIVGAIFMATAPLALNLSRFGGGYALVLLFSASSLYFLTKFWQKPKAHSLIGLVISLAGGIYSHPSFNWFVLGLGMVALLNLPAINKFKAKRTVKGLISILAYLLIAAPAVPSMIRYFSNVSFDGSIGRTVELWRSLIVKSSAGGSFNLTDVPYLNAFVGLMLVLGLMVVVSGLKRFSSRVVLIMFLSSLLPYVLLPASTILAERIVVLLVPALALAAVGTDYLLKQWHNTFPINSAARQAGSIMLVVLLFFSSRHGYSQYFLAWRATTETKRSFASQSVAAAKYVSSEKSEGTRYLISTADEYKVAKFLDVPNLKHSLPDAIKSLSKLSGSTQFILLPSVKDQALDALAKKFTGGKLKPVYDQQKNELFLIYTVKP